MQKSITQKGLLKFIEKFIRNNFILYSLIRPLIIHFNIFEEDFRILINHFKNTRINILDIGASDGISAKFFLNNLNVNKIFCYEPNKDFVKKLKKLKKKFGNIFIKNYGINDKFETKNIFYPEVNFFNFKFKIFTYSFYDLNELKQQLKIDTKNFKKIKIIKSKIFLKKFQPLKEKINLIKLDVNGNELAIIKALKKKIIEDKPMIIIENNKDLKKIFNILKKFNYKKFFNNNMKFSIHTSQKVLNVFFINN